MLRSRGFKRAFLQCPFRTGPSDPFSRSGNGLEITTEGAAQYFNGASQNIGVLLGDKFGSTDVDCDCSEAITAAREMLPGENCPA